MFTCHFINPQRSTIVVGLFCAVLCILLLFVPGLTNFFFHPSRAIEGGIFLGAIGGQISLALTMAGFGLIRFLGVARTNNLKYLILGIYFAPLLIDASFVAFVWIESDRQILELQEKGLIPSQK